MSFLNSLKKILLLGLLSIFFVSCGGSKPMVENVQVSTEHVDGDIWVDLTADLSIGDVTLPQASVPILLPKTGEEVGLLTLESSLDGSNSIVIELNVSDAANLDLESVKLPNGASVPLIGDRPVIAVPIGKGAEVYISLTSDSAALGVSIPIKSFDSIGEKVGTTALMPLFNKNDIVGAAGVYTSKTAGQNGFALVADVSNAIGNLVKQKSLDDHMSRMPQMQQDVLDLNAHVPSRSKERKINKMLLKMHKRKQQLQLN